jgi:N12 class adenine-specific DNA methylase
LASKTQLIFELSQNTVKKLSDYENWAAFLRSASWQYKYPFEDQVLIYAQRPDATACASFEIWTNKLHRWINRGSKGIALLSDSNGHFKLKYVFDISDTNSFYGNEVKLWQYSNKHEAAVIETLENTFGELEVTTTVIDAVICAARNAVQDNKQDYLHELKHAKENSFLEELDDFNVEVAFERLATFSVAYIVLNRLGQNPDDIFSIDDEFRNIMDFNTPETISILGSAASAITETALNSISKTIQAAEREEKSQTKKFVEKEKPLYDNNRNNIERDDSHDRSASLQDGGRLPDTRLDRTGGQSDNRQIRNDEKELHQTAQTGAIQQPDDNRQADRPSAGDRPDGEGTTGTDYKADDRQGIPAPQSDTADGVGAGNEQHPSLGGGNNSVGTGTQLSLFPTEEEQKNTIRRAEQANFAFGSAFSISQQMIDEVLCDGGNKKGSKLRICTQYQKQKSLSENATFLKDEYAVGGKGFMFGDTPVSVWFDEGGIKTTYGKEVVTDEYTLSWEQAAKRVGELLDLGRYMQQEEINKAGFNERKELADKIWYLHQDRNGEFPLDEMLFEGGFPESTARIAESLDNPEKRKQIIDGINGFAKDYEENRDLLRFHLHRPQELANNLSELLIERKQFTASEPISFGGKRFITQNEIDSALKRGSGIESEKMRIYSFFIREKAVKKRIDFLKKEYGTGGTHTMNGVGYEGHSGKGITLSRGDISMPYDKVTLSWSQVAKRIDILINTDRYLSQEDISYIPQYEKKQIAGEISTLKIVSSEEKQYDLGFGYFGNGLTVWNRLEKVDNDYKTVAHIDNDGNITYYDKEMPENIKAQIQAQAETLKQEELSIPADEKTVVSDDGDTVSDEGVAIDNDLAEKDEETPDYSDIIGKEVVIDNHRFLIESVSDFSGNVSMRDITFEEQVGFPINRSESLEIVRQYLEPEKEEKLTPSFSKPKPSKVPNTMVYPEIEMSQRHNFVITDDELGYGGAKEKFRNNMEAIRVLKDCELDNRLATPEEQEVLSRYVGWGGLSDAFDESKSNWTDEYLQLKTILTPDEYEQARASTLNAHYTSPTVIKAIYKVLENMGFRQGNILEPSCGIGNFMGLVPDSMADSKIYGIELDSITGRIAQQLYQKNSVAIQGFEDTMLPDSFFDVAVGNVPFGNYKVMDKKYDKNNFLIHDYFFAKTLDKVRPGGIIAFITSSGTMDKKNSAIRKYIAQRADLLGAIRLPNNTFLKNAGTQVTADILFLQKRDRMIDIEPDWVHLDKLENGITVNQYFVDNPDMMLGEMTEESTQYGKDNTCKPFEDSDLAELLEGAIQNIHAQITEYEFDELIEDEDLSIPADPNVRNFSYTIVDGDIYFRENSRMNKIETNLTATNRIKGMIAIRDCVRDLIEYQAEDYSEHDIKMQQEKLNTLYDNFTAKYGLINSRGNNMAFSDDSSYFLLCSLENLDENGELERKADMFTKRTIGAKLVITKVDTASEALAVSLSEKARIDMEYMSSLTGKEEQELFEELKGVIFLNPMHTSENDGREKYLTAGEYLSGNIREKLEWAKRSAQLYPEDYTVNVESLTAVQPKDLTAAEITVKLGTTWIPPEYIKEFTFELLETSYWAKRKINVHYSKLTGDWNISGKSRDRANVKANSTYGTDRINAYKIIEDTLNLKDVRIFDYVENENGNKVAVLNRKETTIAQQKQDSIKAAFDNWIWKDPDRREKLTTIYNTKFNSTRPREYDGSHLTFNGMNPEISLQQHQKSAVARIMYGGNSLLGHVVGAGKTWTMVAAAMESRRLGLCNKPLFVVPNHLTEQWASEFLQLYPSANIMVATKKDFETKNRKKFCGRIATGDYDAVIIGHSQFEKIPMSVERQRTILENQRDDVLMGLSELKNSNAERFSIKQLEKTKRNLETKLAKLNDQSRKDDVVTFEELGVDRIFIDEAHYYKNLFLYTKMRNVGGIAQTEAQKSSDLFMKCRYLDELTGSKGVIFATGTPISNSMVELYTMQRYLQYETLARNELQHFDAWASTFGETVTAIELAPEGTGYRAKTRFAKFFNLPELMAMFKDVADIQTADMLNLPVPEAQYYNIAVEPTEIQREMVKALSERAEKVRNKEVEPHEDNMLLITNDGRKLALDQRLMNDILPDDENSKVSVCANKVFEIWEQNKDKRLTQLVFCDLSTPKKDDFNVYDDIQNKLIRKGVPESDIEFIHNADSEVKKKELFAKVRKGDVRIMLGSTTKMGAGTNVQRLLLASHDLDCPWRPSDLEQRAGRIIRQGNLNDTGHIYRYVTKDTFDAYLYQLVEKKQKFIAQIMTSKSPVRSAEDIDETALSYAEIKALATGNPYIKEKMNLDTQVAKLKLIKSSFMSQKYELEDRVIKYYPRQIKEHRERIKGYDKDMKVLSQYPKMEDKFHPMTIDGLGYYTKEKAGKALIERCKAMTTPDEISIGDYRGFSMSLSFDKFSSEYNLTLKNALSYKIALGSNVYGNIQRIDNALESMQQKQDVCKQNLAELEKQFETAKVECKKEFPQETELAEKSTRLAELDTLLNMDKPEHEMIDGDLEVDEISEERQTKREYEMER